jgi:hypothetical protein
MELDPKKIDDAVLALLLLGLHDGGRAWRGLTGARWSACTKRGSVVFTKAGFERAQRLFEKLFGK